MGDPEEKTWIRNRIEGPDKNISFTENGKRAILNKIIQAASAAFINIMYKWCGEIPTVAFPQKRVNRRKKWQIKKSQPLQIWAIT